MESGAIQRMNKVSSADIEYRAEEQVSGASGSIERKHTHSKLPMELKAYMCPLRLRISPVYIDISSKKHLNHGERKIAVERWAVLRASL